MRTTESSPSIPQPQFQIQSEEAQVRADHLRSWRRTEADKLGIRPFRIFGDRTLNDLANKNPDSTETLYLVFGLGTQRVTNFGAQILRELRGLESETSLQSH